MTRAKLMAMSHEQRVTWFRKHPPVGVPRDEDGWPETFGDIRIVHGGRNGYCLQCMVCAHYTAGKGDWGRCHKRSGSEYAGLITFEHWTCAKWWPGYDS